MAGLMQKKKGKGSAEDICALTLQEEFTTKPLKDFYGKLYTTIAPIVDLQTGSVCLKNWICNMLTQPLG